MLACVTLLHQITMGDKGYVLFISAFPESDNMSIIQKETHT